MRLEPIFSENEEIEMGKRMVEKLNEQLHQYGFDEIADHKDIGNVESIILKDMLQEKIEKDTKKLGKILSPIAKLQYKRLAFKFLTTPNPDKASKAYEIFERYQELLANL
ncbi:MAG: hypothetical protein HOE40_03705 [Candidatus Pacebacteria bacterium]|jgi:hypothetical protein|nr:hypothetical protein [Candidatus Paceibacterota bacterium]